jgi:hypothetical protein
MTRKQESITLSLSLEQKAELENIALEFGYLWGENPNISALIKAIAKGELLLIKSESSGKQNRVLAKNAIASIQDAITLLKLIA